MDDPDANANPTSQTNIDRMLGNDVGGETFPPTNAPMDFALLKSQQVRDTTLLLAENQLQVR
jgi:hypothetical protein